MIQLTKVTLGLTATATTPELIMLFDLRVRLINKESDSVQFIKL